MAAEIGRGGMGVVYRALDRLTQTDVAIKGVHVPTGQEFDEDLAIALVHEFQVLCVLRHPYIISVLDYGIDQKGASFYTMELLEGSVDVVTGAGRVPIPKRIDYLLQIVEALVYLHSHGIIHRDLKPANVLLADDRARLVDFGLAAFRDEGWEEPGGATGTALYIAPEIVSSRHAPSVASDLHALGVLAYEILAGRLIDRSRMEDAPWWWLDPAELGALGLPEGYSGDLERLLRRLTAPDPARRPSDARAVLNEIKSLMGLSQRRDLPVVRESYLQASKFVGRDDEMRQLGDAILRMSTGRGSAWLITGQSGIGKTRFTSELIPRAVAAGARVFRGQARPVASDGYDVWRDVIRALAIETNPDPATASILKIAVPGIDETLGTTSADPPPVTPAAAQRQLFDAVSSLIEALGQPCLILLEDIHQAGSESVALIDHLAARAPESRLMLIATARTDEPWRVQAPPANMQAMNLPRLTRDEIEKLADEMLGAFGRPTRIAAFLNEQSEGNPFFLVETMRSLAEEVGQLERLARIDPSGPVTSQGIKALVDARLAQLQPECFPLIEYAALLGREVDRSVLSTLQPGVDFQSWLDLSAASGIIAGRERSWYFAHDKFREGLVANIPSDRRAELHGHIAQAIETVVADTGARCEELVHHWSETGNEEKEIHYAVLSADRAIGRNSNAEAVSFVQRALDLNARAPEGPPRDGAELGLRLRLGGALVTTMGFAAPPVLEAFSRAHDICRSLGNDGSLVPVNWGLWNFYIVNADLDRATDLSDAVKKTGEDLAAPPFIRLGRHLHALCDFWRGDLHGIEVPVRDFFRQLDRGNDPIFDLAPVEDPEVGALSYYAWLRFLQGDPDEAAEVSARAVALAESLDRADHLAFALGFAGWYSRYRGDFERAEQLASRSIDLALEHGFPYWLGAAKILRGSVAARAQAAEGALAEIDEGFAIWHQTNSKLFAPSFEYARAQAHFMRGDHGAATSALREAATALETTGERFNEAEIERAFGLIAHRQGELEEARSRYERAIATARRQGARSLELRAVVSLAWLQSGDEQTETLNDLRSLVAGFPLESDWPELVSARRLLND